MKPIEATMAREAAEERLCDSASRQALVDVVVTLRGRLQPLKGRLGRWRIRTVNGRTTFDAACVVAVTPVK
jgi:hypothetical protein